MPRPYKVLCEFPQELRGSIAASVVDDDDLHRAAIGLRQNRLERLANERGAVVHGNDEADAGHAVATISPYSCSSAAQTTSSPQNARTRAAASIVLTRQAGASVSTRAIADASAFASPSGITWPPPRRRITSPQPESSATTTGVPDRIDSIGASPNISWADG